MKKVLIVHPERSFHESILSSLSKEKFRCISAFDGIEGLHKFKNEEFDLVILSIQMTKVDVLKFYSQMKEMLALKKIEPGPVLIVGTEDDIKLRRDKLERCDFLVLPLNGEILQSKITALFEKPKSRETAKVLLNPGQVLFHEGDFGDCMYYVVSGTLKGTKKGQNGSIDIGIIHSGELVGEMCIINGDKRTLTVSAQEKTELIMIPGEKIMSIVQGQPKWIQVMIENLSRRLKDTIKQLA